MYLTVALMISMIVIKHRSEAFRLRLSKVVNLASSYTTKKKTNRWAGVTRAPPGDIVERKPLRLSEVEESDSTKDRPFTLPPGQFRPKQSLGQNFLSDQNYVMKICDSFSDDSEKGTKVVEIGPGPGALTRVLYQRYPNMTALEIDQRAVAFLGEKLPGLRVIHIDVLEADWPQLAAERGGPLNIIANLPYYIVSQVLFSLADSHKAIKKAVVTMQLEVAERIVAKPNTKAYGIPSVVFQLYGAPKINFKIPPTVFYPKPNVDSALLTLDFTQPHPLLAKVNGDHLRKYVRTVITTTLYG
jgi:ribosomal RNA small subunit methyltransferase A